jgi:hypothetical protein
MMAIPLALSIGWFAGLATAHAVNRQDLQRLRMLTRYCATLEGELRRWRRWRERQISFEQQRVIQTAYIQKPGGTNAARRGGTQGRDYPGARTPHTPARGLPAQSH